MKRGKISLLQKAKKCGMKIEINYLSDQMKQIREYPCAVYLKCYISINVKVGVLDMMHSCEFLLGIPTHGEAEKRGTSCSPWGPRVLCHLLI